MSPQFATRLSEACDARGLSDLGLAEAVGVPVTAVLGWLRGTDRPGPEDRHRLAEVLDVDPVWLETGEGTGPLVDIDRERAEYQAEAGWRFREVPEDGALDYGNANIWAFTPDLDTLVREVGQNTLDVIRDSTASLVFRVITVEGSRLEDFLAALRWSDLQRHIAASARSGQKLGRALQRGLDELESKGRLTMLRIEEHGTWGLTGAERGEGSNFAALTRNNLDSQKRSSAAGGAFGLGKAVLWRSSSL